MQVYTDHKNQVTFMTTQELSERQGRWMRFLTQYNYKIIYRPWKEGGKPDALTSRAGDLPTAGDKSLTRNMTILLPPENWGTLEVKEIKVEPMELVEFQETDEG